MNIHDEFSIYPHLASAERFLPKCVKDALIAFPGDLILAGGFLRTTSCGERPYSDHDLFLCEKGKGLSGHVVSFLSQQQILGLETEWHVTPRAVAARINGAVVQLVLGWHPKDAMDLIRQFDLTTSKAAMWYAESNAYSVRGICSQSFLRDISQRAIVYEVGADPVSSIIRITKFLRKGFTISSRSLVDFIAACCEQVGSTGSVIDTQRKILRAIVDRDPSPEMMSGLLDDRTGIEAPAFEHLTTAALVERLFRAPA